VEYDLLINVDGGVEPDLLFLFDLDLFLINGNASRSSRQLLLAVIGVVSIPVVHRLACPIDAKPTHHVRTFRERC